jgi:hypothetical protein
MGVNARQTKVGINIATSGSWGLGVATATAVGTGDGHYVRDDLGIQLKMVQSLDEAAAQNFIGSVQTGNVEAIAATIPTWLHYADTWLAPLMALAFGTGATAPSQVGTSTIYTATFEPATNKTGKYATIVRDKGQFISEVSGAKFTGFELRAGDQGRMELDFSCIGNTEKIDSTINTATQVTALTFPPLGLRAFFDDAVVWLNTQGGTTLSATHALKVTSMKLKFAQPMDSKHVGGQTTIVEPEESGFPDVTLDLTFARFDAASDDFFAGHRDTTLYKAVVAFAGPLIGTSTIPYEYSFTFPNLYVTSYQAPIPGGAGQVVPSVAFKALSTTTAPTGMTGVTVPIRFGITGTGSTNPFV